jgi:hypothetical protein
VISTKKYEMAKNVFPGVDVISERNRFGTPIPVLAMTRKSIYVREGSGKVGVYESTPNFSLDEKNVHSFTNRLSKEYTMDAELLFRENPELYYALFPRYLEQPAGIGAQRHPELVHFGVASGRTRTQG